MRSGSHDRSLPALQRLCPPGMRVVSPPSGLRPLAPRMLLERVVPAAAPARVTSCRRIAIVNDEVTPTWCSRPLVVVQAEQQRADALVRSRLVPAEAGDDAVGGAHVLHLDHRALARLVGAVRRLRDHAVEAGALEARQPLGRLARDRASSASGGSAARRCSSSRSRRARRSLCGQFAQVLPVERRARRTRRTRPASPAPAWRRARPPDAAAAAARRSRARAAWR